MIGPLSVFSTFLNGVWSFSKKDSYYHLICRGVCTSSVVHNPRITNHNQEHGVCELWE